MFALRNCKLFIRGTLGMPGYAHPKLHYQFVQNFCVYMQAKNQLHLLRFSGDITKICKLNLGSLCMPGYAHPK